MWSVYISHRWYLWKVKILGVSEIQISCTIFGSLKFVPGRIIWTKNAAKWWSGELGEGESQKNSLIFISRSFSFHFDPAIFYSHFYLCILTHFDQQDLLFPFWSRNFVFPFSICLSLLFFSLCFFIMIDAYWFWLMPIDAYWCWLMLIGADWCWLILRDSNWCFMQ